jgi:hypothetical protein
MNLNSDQPFRKVEFLAEINKTEQISFLDILIYL